MVAIKSLGDHHYHDHKSTSDQSASSSLCLVNLFSVLGIAGASYAMSFYMSVILLQYLSIQQYGDMMVAKQILTVVSVALAMGTKNVSKRFLINYLHEKSDRYMDFIWWHCSYLLKLILIFSVAYSFFVLMFVWLDTMEYLELAHFHVAFWSIASAPFLSIASIMTVYLLSFGYVVLYDFLVGILQNFLWIFLVYAWMFWAPIPTVWHLILFLVSQSLFQFFVLGLCVFILLRDPLRKTFSLTDRLYVDDQWLSHRFSSLMIDLYSSLPVMIFLTTIEVFHSGEHMVGHLSLALSISILFYLIPQSIYPLIYSSLDYLVRQSGDSLVDTNLLIRANRSVILLNCLALGIVIYYGYDILFLFGEQSNQAYQLLILFSIVSLVGGLYYPMLNFALISQGQSQFIGKMDVLFYCVLLFLGPLITIYFGGYYCVYLYALMILFQFVVSNLYFTRRSGFFAFKLF
tara:strand:+ start:167 stop:1546 length:1380 start_codon:yes stop_codon:yes gene_type:complete